VQLTLPALFDHLVGATEDGKWNVQAERPGGLEVDDQLYPRSLLNRQIRRLLAIENPADIDADDAILISGAGAVVVTSRYFRAHEGRHFARSATGAAAVEHTPAPAPRAGSRELHKQIEAKDVVRKSHA